MVIRELPGFSASPANVGYHSVNGNVVNGTLRHHVGENLTTQDRDTNGSARSEQHVNNGVDSKQNYEDETHYGSEDENGVTNALSRKRLASQNEEEDEVDEQEADVAEQLHGEDGLESALPHWATVDPVDGYIKHPVAGYVMHPSFYDNRHLLPPATNPRYIYDGEVDGPLCPPNQKCVHLKNCFEVRVRMAVMAYCNHNISFRDAEYIWRVSRSTIQRRKAFLDKCSPLAFLITPEHSKDGSKSIPGYL